MSGRTLSLACLCGIALWSSAAPSVAAQKRKETEAPSVRRDNAHPDRLVFGSTGVTHPKGTFYLSNYELLLFQAGYAFTDGLQASLTGTYLGEAHLFEAAVKANVLRTPRLRVSITTAIDHLRVSDTHLLFARGGGAATWCMDDGCRSFMNLDASLFLHGQADTFLPLWLAAGWNVRLSESIAALLEYSTLTTIVGELSELELPYFFVSYGLRFGGRSWAFDFTMVRSLQGAEQRGQDLSEQLGDLFGVPFLAFTYRWTH